MKNALSVVILLMAFLMIGLSAVGTSLEQFDLKTASIREFDGNYRLLTLRGMESFHGRGGTPAYAAASGKIYDFSGLARWRGGTHLRMHEAGEELTSDLIADSPHGDARLARGEVVALLVLTASELREHAGGNQNKIYVAAEGKVYDVTALRTWRGGSHAGLHEAGQDLTRELVVDSPHGKTAMEGAYVVAINAFTPDELLQFDGTQNSKSFIAIDGKVFDISLLSEWIELQEESSAFRAGKELTSEFSQVPASLELLEEALVVGILVFDIQALSRFDGQDEAKSYVAYDRTVYDVSGIQAATEFAGTDITELVEADPSVQEVIEGSLLIGFMVNQ